MSQLQIRNTNIENIIIDNYSDNHPENGKTI